MNRYKPQGKITLFDSENTQQKLSNFGNLCCFQAVPWPGGQRQRLTTVQKADEILVLDHGHIVEHGTHAELYRQQGMYYNWVKLQEL